MKRKKVPTNFEAIATMAADMNTIYTIAAAFVEVEEALTTEQDDYTRMRALSTLASASMETLAAMTGKYPFIPCTVHELAKKISELYELKNADYGNSFARTFEKVGIAACYCRIADKYHRYQSLCQSNKSPNFESMADTMLDLASYCVMSIMCLGEE
jgi:hypothetical protein